MWGEKKDFQLNPGELYFSVPLGLKIHEYFHTLWSMGARMNLVQGLMPERAKNLVQELE